MFAVIFVFAATLTLLPGGAGQARSAGRQARTPWAHSGEHRSAMFAAWGERLWRQPVRWGRARCLILVGLAIPVTQLKTAMPSIKVVPSIGLLADRLLAGPAAFGPGATGPLQIVTPAAGASDRGAGRERRSGNRGADADADEQRVRAGDGDPQTGPVRPGRRPDDRQAPG